MSTNKDAPGDLGFLHFKVTRICGTGTIEIPLSDLKLEVTLTTFSDNGDIEREKKIVPALKNNGFRFDAHWNPYRQLKINVLHRGYNLGHWSSTLQSIYDRITKEGDICTSCQLVTHAATIYMNTRYILESERGNQS